LKNVLFLFSYFPISSEIKCSPEKEFEVKYKIWITWFPAFRSNYEVAQIIQGGDAWKVFLSSVNVKSRVSIAATICALVIPLFIDITETSSKEGFASFIIVGIITLIVGLVKLKNWYK